LEMAQWLHGLGGVDVHAQHDAFVWAYALGYLQVAQWLCGLGGVDIHTANDCAFETVTMFRCNTEFGRWLVTLQPEYSWNPIHLATLRLWSHDRHAWVSD
jgi:hypothetical protein